MSTQKRRGRTPQDEVLLQFLGNLALRQAEGVYELTGDLLHPDRSHLAVELAAAEHAGGLHKVRWDLAPSQNDVLAAFQLVAEKLDHELAIAALSEASNPEVFRHVAAVRGGAASVANPLVSLLPELERRRARGVESRVLVLHNHPQHAAAHAMRLLFDCGLGPSVQDREELFRWMHRSRDLLAEIEFWVLEGKDWRPFTWISAPRIFDSLARLWQTSRGPGSEARP